MDTVQEPTFPVDGFFLPAGKAGKSPAVGKHATQIRAALI